MKRSNLLVVAGGILAAVAFFLPYNSALFGQGKTLLNAIQSYFQFSDAAFGSSTQFRFLIELVIILLCEPIGAVLLIAGGLLALRMHRATSIWGLMSAAVNLTVLLWYFTFFYAFDLAYKTPGGVGYFLQLFGIGYWLAVIGYALGLIGSLLGWLGQSRQAQTREPQPAPTAQPQPASPQRWALHIRPGALLVLFGGLIATWGFFTRSCFPFLCGSLFYLVQQPPNDLILWPDLLAMLLLLLCGSVALTGRNKAHLASLIGALSGLTFLLLIVFEDPGSTSEVFAPSLVNSYWLTFMGCALGSIGALLGLLERPALPVRSDAPTALTPS